MNRQIDRSKPFLTKPQIKITDTGLSVSALGKTVEFEGEILKAEGGDFTCLTKTDGMKIVAILKAKDDCVLEEYRYFEGVWKGVEEICVAKTAVSGICAFLHAGDISFFLSLDFPYSDISQEGMKVTIGVDPSDKVKKGKIYEPHTLSIGATRLAGERSQEHDLAEIEAFSEYVMAGMPENFRGEKPIFSTTCITNRMTDVREGRIFYSMNDNPTLTLSPETIKEEVRLCGELGIEYYQAFEGFFDWEEDGSSEKNLKEIVALGKELGVRVGDYMTTLGLHCPHYNYHDRYNKNEETWITDRDGTKRALLCYGKKETVDYLKNTIVRSIKRNGEQMICLDGDACCQCFAKDHGHHPGSWYAQVRGLVEFMKALDGTSPLFMTWSNAGNWLQFMPKLLWYNQNVYLSDPHPRNYSASLNVLKYLGDVRREQMVTVHEKYFVPYCLFTNCEYYAFRHSRVADDEVFEYSFLQGLAVTPNMCVGEMRTFFERTMSKKLPKVKAFMRKWFSYIRENIDCWKNVQRLGDTPDQGANEAYSHMNGNRGFITFVNQNCYAQKFSFRLDGSIGLAGKKGDRFILSEIYPGEHLLAEQTLPGPLYGEEITLDIPAYSVRYIRIDPYDEDEEVRLYGAAGKMLKTSDGGYEFSITEEAGRRIPAAVWFKEGIPDVRVRTVPTVPKYTFPSFVENLRFANNNVARFDLIMPRERFRAEIQGWSVDGSEKKYRLTQDVSDFSGGYIHNLYRENQSVVLTANRKHFKKNEKNVCRDETLDNIELPPFEGEPGVPKRRGTVYETSFYVPFIEWNNVSMQYGLDEVIELVFSDCALVDDIKARLNGRDIQVHEFRNINREMKSFYIELTGDVGSGSVNSLRVEVKWNESEVKRRFKDPEKAVSDEFAVLGRD